MAHKCVKLFFAKKIRNHILIVRFYFESFSHLFAEKYQNEL